MKKVLVFIICFYMFLNIPITAVAKENRDYDIELKQDLLILMISYPDNILGIEKNNDKVYVVMKSGKKILYDDKIKKNHDEKLANPDLQDVLEQYYPLDKKDIVMDKSFNPGRFRNYDLLNEVYGISRNAIEKNLVNLKYGYPNYQFNKQNNANIALDNTLKFLITLSKDRNDISSILYPGSGTYNYRLISGTNRLSPHSYGIAIDLKSDKKDYWKWGNEKDAQKRISEYPKDLVKTFEDNNFVWGGKWGYFDILHFEYRPEIILKAKYFTNWSNNEDWFYGCPLEDENIKNYIDIIEKSLS